MKTEELKCDCGCGATEVRNQDFDKSTWLFLSQPNQDTRYSEPKLSRDFHFKSLGCLKKWSDKASEIGAKLSESARTGPHPRGTLISDNFPGIYV